MVLGRGQGPLTKGVSGAIGLATEAFAHHKESTESKEDSATKTSDQLSPPPRGHEPGSEYGADHQSDSSQNEDEEDWIRDEMEMHLESPRTDEESGNNQSVDDIVEAFAKKLPPPSYASAVGRLPCAVIIPQRRPETNRRALWLRTHLYSTTVGLARSFSWISTRVSTRQQTSKLVQRCQLSCSIERYG